MAFKTICQCDSRDCAERRTAAIAAHIEDITRDMFAAIERRDFDLDRGPWIHIADDFCCINATRNKRDHFKLLRHFTEGNSDFQVSILSLSSHVYLQAGYAEVYATAKASGGILELEGIARQYVSRYEYRERKGEWFMVKETVINGMAEDL